MASYISTEPIESPIENGDGIARVPGSTSKFSALQNRIAKVLSASYADLELRDSLSLLDHRGFHNTAESRRTFRIDVQQELIQCNGEIVHDFGDVAAQLQRIGDAINRLNSSCAEMRKRITAANRETGPMMGEAKEILTDKRRVETKQHLLDAFNTHFVVSDLELATLTSTAEPVNDDFFRALTHVKCIHHDSQVLLGTENQRLGLDILEQSSRHLNAAFQKLFRWTQRELKSLDLENPQISAPIRRALRVLAERPSLFQTCLDFFAEARETILSNNFYAALTGAAVDSNVPVVGKAIELSASDPLRYVSDMMAWTHSATVSERETVEVLLISDGDDIAKGFQAGIESEPWSRDGDSDAELAYDGRKALVDLVDRDLTSVFRQLRQRTEQVIQSHEDAALAYKISNLVAFYYGIFTTLVGADSALVQSLQLLAETAMRSFRSTMRDYVASLQADLAIAPDDLAAPDFLVDALSTLQVLMKSYDTSAAPSTHTQRVEAFQPVLQEALDPFLAGCENLANRLRSPQSHIFAMNCLQATSDVLRSYAFADRSEELQPKLQEHEERLTDAMHDWFLRQSGLANLIDNLHSPSDLSSSYKDPRQLVSAAQQFDAFLPTATENARAFLDPLEDKTLVRRLIERAAERFCEDFVNVEELIVRADEIRAGQVNDEAAEEEMVLREIFPRTGDEIRVLLS